MSKNIWVLNHYAGSPYHGMEFRHYYLAKEWIKQGCSVTIVAASFSHIRNVNIFHKKWFVEEDIDGIKYVWLKTSTYKSNGLRRFINIAQYSMKLIRYSLNRVKIFPNIIIASSPHPFVFVNAWFLKRRTNAKIIFEVRDLWPLTLLQMKPNLKRNPIVYLMQLVENLAYKKSDLTVSLLPLAFQYMKKHGLSKQKFKYIPNGISDKLAVCDNFSDEDKRLFCNNSFKIGYAGNFGEANALLYLIKAFSKLQKYPIVLYLIGDGPEKIKLEKETVGLSNIYFIERTDRKKALGYLSLVDVCYIGLAKSDLFKYGISPNKIFDYMYLKKPIIQSINAGNDIVNEANCGISVDAEDVTSVVNAVVKLYNMTNEQRVQLGLNGYEYLIQHHTYTSLGKEYSECFLTI